MLIGDIVTFNARRFGDKTAFKDETKSVTFRQVNIRANCIGNALKGVGMEKGDRIAVLLYNCSEYHELLFAIPQAGFVFVPLNYRLVGKELAYIIENSEANTLIFGEEFSETIEEIRSELPTVINYIVIGRKKTDALEYETVIRNASSDEISTPVSGSDVAYILYTSGTTGRPKGAMLTHKNIITNLFNLSLELQPCQNDLFFNPPPLYHCAAQCTTMAHFFYGCTTITIRQFDPERVLSSIADEKPNIVHLVPAMQNMVMTHPDVNKYNLSHVQKMIYGASSMMVSQLKRSIEIFGCQFIQCAGLTEAGPILTILRPEEHVVDGPENLVRRLASAGKEVKLTEVRIVDREGNEVPPNTPGEEIARGDNIMKGYWRQPEATAETILDGWLHTGDICVKDEDGYVYYVDRIKDMIVRGGENVYPREIEEVIATHPDVLEVAVIGVPDDRLEEEIMAVVTLKQGVTVTDKGIIELCEQNLAKFKKPRYVKFVESLPKNPTGKILKRELRKDYEKINPSRKPLK